MSEGADGSRSAADGRTPNVLQWFGVFAQSVAVLVFLAAVYDAMRHQDWPRTLLFCGAAACFAAAIVDANGALPATVADNRDGTYTVSYAPTEPGMWSAIVRLIPMFRQSGTASIAVVSRLRAGEIAPWGPVTSRGARARKRR